jgi:protein dithiol oxidoreductase (disulfide-forming)
MKIARFLFAFLVCLNLNSVALATGNLYEEVPAPQRFDEKNKLEVLEIFWYGCPHCYYLEPALKEWLKTKPKDVTFIKMPAVLDLKHKWTETAKIFYVAEALNVSDKIHKALFEAIHEKKRNLSTEQEFAQFFNEVAGVSKEDFTKAFNSFAVDMKIRNAFRLTQAYGISSVPVLIVNGKYRIDSGQTEGMKNLFKAVDEILNEARNAK